MTNMDIRQLTQIEAQLTDDMLTDEELATALHEAGLPEVARVVTQLVRRSSSAVHSYPKEDR